MLNLFAATGHIHYAKKFTTLFTIMLELPNDHPWLSTEQVFMLFTGVADTGQDYGLTNCYDVIY